MQLRVLAFVLAGGKGTRLHPLTKERAKPAVPFGGRYRIVDFVRAYLSMSQNEHYLKSHMVEDPVAGTRFPKFAAAATLERNGTTYYFMSEKTCSEFAKKEA